MHSPTGAKKRGCLMLRRYRGVPVTIAAAGTLLGMLALAPATTAVAAPTWRTHVCHGTNRHPGELTGLNLDVIVRGICLVRNGPVAVSRNIIITRHSSLIAAFGRHHTRLSVAGNIFVHKGGTLVLGCNPKSFPCLDDPHPKRPSLTSADRVGHSISATAALGVVVHNDWIGHNVSQTGGGGGVRCKPQGPFVHVHSPAYSTYEDNWIGGNVRIRHVHSCWLGVIRNWIRGSANINHNRMKDPDAMEIITNVVLRNLVCFHNNPKVQFGDSHGQPNRVGGHAVLECSFHRLVPNPAGQHHHFSHISVHLHRR
jgi:hypothetical protein